MLFIMDPPPEPAKDDEILRVVMGGVVSTWTTTGVVLITSVLSFAISALPRRSVLKKLTVWVPGCASVKVPPYTLKAAPSTENCVLLTPTPGV